MSMQNDSQQMRRQQEDHALNQAFLWVLGAIFFEGLVVLLNRYFVNYKLSEIDITIALHNFLTILRPVAGVGMLLGAGLVLKGAFARKNVKWQVVFAAVSFALASIAHLALKFQKNGIQMLLVLMPVLAGLAFVFYLYQREMFLVSIINAVSAFAIWCASVGGRRETIAGLIALVILAALVLLFRKNEGVIDLGKRGRIKLFAQETDYKTSLLSCTGGIIAVLVGLILGAGIAHYLVFAVAIWAFCLLVYYTVMMM